MANEGGKQEQSFLLDLLKTTYQNQDVYLLLSENLDKLNDDFASFLREWVSDRFTKEPAKAVNVAKVIVKFCSIIHKFDRGEPTSNLQIAIAGYETALKVLTQEAFPQDWDNIKQAIVAAYRQRQKILQAQNNERLQDKQEENEAKPTVEVEELPAEPVQMKVEVESAKAEIVVIQPHQEAINSDRQSESNSLANELQELKQRQLFLELAASKSNLFSNINEYNTAIFFDIENLTMGKENPNCQLFSLKDIKTSIEKHPKVNKIALQSAYADWSDGRLRGMRNELQDLGIDTVQIFDYEYKNNSANIQLAIDVMELIHNRPGLQVFAIVSGDGAFASLAKKLREFGKTVIGCAYGGQSNRVLKAVCDEFIPIPEPQEQLGAIHLVTASTSEPGNSDLGNGKKSQRG